MMNGFEDSIVTQKRKCDFNNLNYDKDNKEVLDS